jgi:hypothetical protein
MVTAVSQPIGVFCPSTQLALLWLFRTSVYLIILFVSFTFAQQTQVSVRIPIFLKLSIDGQLADSQANVPLTVNVTENVPTLFPATSHLKVLSNTNWQLSIQAMSTTSRLKLNYRLDDVKQWKHLREYSQTLREGSGRVNAEMVIHYGLAAMLPNGSYQAVVSYTLTNP